MAKPNTNLVAVDTLGNTSTVSKTLSISKSSIKLEYKSAPRTMRATWDWTVSKASDGRYTTSHYAIEWRYKKPGVEGYVTGEKDARTESYIDKYYEFTAPDDATDIAFSVMPVPATKLDDNENEIPYFNTTWSGWVYFTFLDKPEIPPVPSISIEGTKLKIEVSGVNVWGDDIIKPTNRIRFEIVKVDSNDTSVLIYDSAKKTDWLTMIISSRAITETVAAGEYYRVRSQAAYYDNVTKTEATSGWSEYSEAVVSPPSTPIIEEILPLGDNEVRIKWTKASSAEEYTIQYVNKDDIPDDLIIVEDKNNAPADYNYKYITLTELFTYTNLRVNEVKVQMVSGDSNEYVSYVLTGVPTGDYYIRVYSANKSGQSEGSEIQYKSLKSFVTGKEPASPTTWSNITTANIGEPITLYWVHNSEDNSVLKSSKVEISYNGETETLFIDSNAFEYTSEYGLVFTAPAYDRDEDATRYCHIDTSNCSAGNTIKWKVWTAGAAVDENGDLKYCKNPSVERTIELYDAPNLSTYILGSSSDGPIDTVTSFPFKVKMEVNETRNQTPVSYHLAIVTNNSYEIIDDTGNIVIVPKSTQVYSKYIDINTTLEGVLIEQDGRSVTVEISAGDCDLLADNPYTITATVAMSSGLRDDDSIENFYVEWDTTVPIPGGNVTVDTDALTAVITPVPYDSEGNILMADDYEFIVYRREVDGTFVKIGDVLEYNESAIDKHPALDYARYRIVARSKVTGEVAYNDLPSEYIGDGSLVIEWAERQQIYEPTNGDIYVPSSSSGSLLKLPYNLDVSNSYSNDTTLVKYVGRDYPVDYHGTQKDFSATYNTDIIATDAATLYAIRRLANWRGKVYVREPSGVGYWAVVTVSYNIKHMAVVIPVTISATRVEGE